MDMLRRFVYFVNILDPSLKFMVEIGGERLKCLDLLMSIRNGRLETTVYSKPTDGHLYLHNDSCHPRSTKLGVEKGVALRLRRICSTDDEFDRKSKKYMALLANRKHSPKDIIQNFKNAKEMTRDEARTKRIPCEEKKHRFFTEFNPNSPNISKILKRHEHMLRGHEKLNKLFPPGSLQVVNRRTKNLQELMLRADPYSVRHQVEGRYIKCGRCDSCKNFVTGASQIKATATGKVFKLWKNLDCSTPNVVYVAECEKCVLQGVGSTVDWKPRLSNYKSHIRNGHMTCRIVKHFAEVCPHQDDPVAHMRFHIIDAVDNVEGLSVEKVDELLLEKEKLWIRNLVTCHKGMNSTHDLSRTKRTERENLD